NAAIAAEAALIVGRSHKDAIDRTRVDTQGAEHALGVIDLEAVDPEAFADRVLDFFDVDAVDGASAGAFVTTDTGRQIEPVEASIPGLHRHGQLGIFELLREGAALVGLKEVPQGYVHPLADRL